MAFNPLIAVLILNYRYNKSAGTKDLLKRAFDYKRIKEKRWYVPIIFLMHAMMFLAYWVMHLVGLPLPEPVILFPVFFMTAMGEEMGWLGYAIDPMQDRLGALKASIIMGAVWGLWHLWGVYSNRQWVRMDNMAISRFGASMSSYHLAL